MLLLALLAIFSSLDTVESSKLKRARRSIENSEESETNAGKRSSRRRLTMADDVFTGTSREFEVVGYHRAVGATVIKIIRGFLGGIGSIFKFMTRLVGTKAIVEEPEPEPATMMSSIYDSISSAMSGSNSTSTPAKTSGQKSISKSAPLRSKKNLPKATTRGGALGKKSIMEDLVKGGSSSAFDSEDSSIAIVETIQSYLPSTSRLAKLLPTLVAGFVFTTAGTLVGYLWNTEFAATASSYVDYFLGADGEGKSETDSFHDAATSTSSTEGHDDLSAEGQTASVPAVPVTPGRF